MKKRLKKAVLELRNVVNLINDSLDTVERLNVEIDIQQEELRRLRGEVYEEEKIKQDIQSFNARLKTLEDAAKNRGYDKSPEEDFESAKERLRRLEGLFSIVNDIKSRVIIMKNDIRSLKEKEHTHFWK